MPMPPEGDEGFDRVNYVIDSWTMACDAPWYIYIETLKPAALTAFIALLSFGWGDVIRGALRPGGLGRRSAKRKGKFAKRVPAFPEVGNTIGKHLPFAEQIEDFTNWGTKGRYLWRIDTAMQAGLFLWLVADIAEEFIFEWTSLLYKTYWCQEAHLGRFSYYNTTQPAKSAWRWHKHAYGNLDYQYPMPVWIFDGGSTGPTSCTVIATARFSKHPSFPAPTGGQVRIIQVSPFRTWAESGLVEPDDDGNLDVVLKGNIPSNSSFIVQTYHQPSWAYVGLGAIVAKADW